MRRVLSTIENSLWRRRWTNAGEGMAVQHVMLEFYPVHRASIVSFVHANTFVRAFARDRGRGGRASGRVRDDGCRSTHQSARRRIRRRNRRRARHGGGARPVERRASSAERQSFGFSAALPARLRGWMRERSRHRAQGHDALRRGRQLSHGLAGRTRDMPQEMMHSRHGVDGSAI